MERGDLSDDEIEAASRVILNKEERKKKVLYCM